MSVMAIERKGGGTSARDCDPARTESATPARLSCRRDAMSLLFGPVRRGARVADRLVPEFAIVHGFARRLLMLELPDQLELGSVQGARDVAVVGDGHERREARQGRSQCDALLFAAAVLQRDFQADVKRVPPAQMRLERRQ